MTRRVASSPVRDRGAVVVEIALVIPVLVIVTILLLWAASLGATYVRALDAAQSAARQIARGATGAEVPPGMQLQLSSAGEFVVAEVSTRSSAPIAVFDAIAFTITARATAAYEWQSISAVEGAP